MAMGGQDGLHLIVPDRVENAISLVGSVHDHCLLRVGAAHDVDVVLHGADQQLYEMRSLDSMLPPVHSQLPFSVWICWPEEYQGCRASFLPGGRGTLRRMRAWRLHELTGPGAISLDEVPFPIPERAR